MKYGNRSPWKRFFYSPASIGIAIVALYFLMRGGLNVHEKALLAQDRYDRAQTELSSLEHQQQTLKASIDKLSTPAGIESELREKYHGVKDGESVAVIIDPNVTDKVVDSTSSATTTISVSWWQHILRVIGL